MKKLLQINPVIRTNTSTGRIMQEIGELAIANGWDSYIAYSGGRDGIKPCRSKLIPVGGKLSVALHGIWTRMTDRHGLASVIATRRFVRKIKELQPDIIHIHNIHGYFLNYKILFEYLSTADIPVVWTVHDCWLYTGHCNHYARVGCDKWMTQCEKCPQLSSFPASMLVDSSSRNFNDKRRLFTSVDDMTIVTVSDWMREEMSRSFLKDCQFKVVHNGVDLNVFNVSTDSTEVRDRYGLGDKHLILGVTSIWCREKGWDDFMELATMINEDEAIVLVGVTQEQMRKLPHNVTGIPRTENVAQLAALYSAATALVNPTWQDNYPTVNLESIACGTPVITYRTGGSVESVCEDTGYVVEQGDVEGLLAAFRKIKEAGKQTYVGRCRNYAVRYFGKNDRYQEYMALYQDKTRKQ
jgi:glycosyltransferase involved in cell wall biosynthesis